MDVLKTIDGFVTNASSLVKPLQTASSLLNRVSANGDSSASSNPLTSLASVLSLASMAKPVMEAAVAAMAPSTSEQGGNMLAFAPPQRGTFDQPMAAFPQNNQGPLV